MRRETSRRYGFVTEGGADGIDLGADGIYGRRDKSRHYRYGIDISAFGLRLGAR